MAILFIAIIFLISPFVLAHFLLAKRKVNRFESLLRVENQVQRCRDIVNFSYGETFLNVSRRLQLRAGPNKRLIEAFGIVSSFTTDDTDVHNGFLLQAREPLQNISQEMWEVLFREATEVLRRDLNAALNDEGGMKPEGRLLLAQCVRKLCFKVVFSILFSADPTIIQCQDANIITREINTQWLLSKQQVDVSKSELLNSTLEHLLTANSNLHTTPEAALTLILPAYETLWRVVLLTFVSAWQRNQSPLDLKRLGSVPKCLGLGNDEEMQARQLAKEGLRLYPSTKRVYRSTIYDPLSTISADIEACQRDPIIWGADALEFRPGRFDRLTDLQKKAYMPFGLAPHMCPAFSGFGERLITLLVTAMGREFGTDRAEVVFHDAQLDGSPFKELPTGRNDMEDWELVFMK